MVLFTSLFRPISSVRCFMFSVGFGISSLSLNLGFWPGHKLSSYKADLTCPLPLPLRHLWPSVQTLHLCPLPFVPIHPCPIACERAGEPDR